MKKKIKIGYFIDVDFNMGGAPISTKLLAEGISKNENIDCYIIKPKSSKNENIDNVKVIEIEKCIKTFPFMITNPIKWIKLCVYINKIIKLYKFDIIHAQMPFSGMAIGLLKKIGKINKNTKLIYTDRENVSDLKVYHKIRYNYFIGKEYDQIITVSKSNNRYWEKVTKNSIIKTIYNTASPYYDTNDFKEINNNEKMKLLFVGRIVKDKNWKLALKIVSKLKNIDSTFVLSYFNNKTKKEALKMKNMFINNPDVHFEFNLDVNELKKQYQLADIFVMTSKKEAFGRTAVEAMSQRTVVIGTNVGGIPEVIEKKENILDLNSDQFLKRIAFYNINRDELKKDKLWFYNRYVNCFSVSKNYQQNYMIYKEYYKDL